MENTQPTQMQVSTKYALIGSLLLIIAGMALYMMGVMNNTVSNVINLVVMSIAIVLGLRTYRDETLGGSLTFGQGFGTGMLISLIMGVLMAIWTYVFMAFVAPDFIEKILDMSRESMIDRGMDDDTIEQAMKQTAAFMTPAMMSVFAVVGTLLFGLVISLISAAIIQKKPDPELQYEEEILDSTDSESV
ncbi:MAG: DUF4199 domain-containing protein [Bacteroidota bacterium]